MKALLAAFNQLFFMIVKTDGSFAALLLATLLSLLCSTSDRHLRVDLTQVTYWAMCPPSARDEEAEEEME